MQASLPIKDGGLGIRQVCSLALPAYLASAASTADLQSQILSVTSCATDIYFDTYLNTWQTTFGSVPVSEPLPRKQSFWDRPGILASRAVVESSISDSVQMATFLAASAPHSGDWLLALPVSSCGLRLSDDAVRVVVSLRLGCSICVAHTCRCVAMVDVQGQHGLICKQARSRIVRHNVMNDIIVRSLSSAVIPASKEPTGLTGSQGRALMVSLYSPLVREMPVTSDITSRLLTLILRCIKSFCCWRRGTCRLMEGGQVGYSCLPIEFSFYTNRA